MDDSQTSLADLVKSVHEKLWRSAQKDGAAIAWKTHLNDTASLENYAKAMEKLATHYWHATIQNSAKKSRIHWTYELSLEYFTGKLLSKVREKETRIAERLNIKVVFRSISTPLRLLDVGSCYNPFREFDLYRVTAVDIAPAQSSVKKCDFLNVTLDDNSDDDDGDELKRLTRASYDLVVFSFLLEYLPIPQQREQCCKTAYDLLTSEGLLVVITPDSNHVGVNAKIMKTWRYLLAKIGFARIKYEKSDHMHCMAFRKCADKEVALHWVSRQCTNDFYSDMCIPQDFTRKDSAVTLENIKEEFSEECGDLFVRELPFFSN